MGLDGQSLRSFVDEHRPITAREAARIGLGVAEELEHHKGSTRRRGGLNPDHIWLAADGTVRLLEFGDSVEGTGCGSTGCANPDLSCVEQDGAESEVCSLGALLFELVHEHSGAVEEGGEHDGLQDALEAIISKALSADPQQRFSTVGELGDALRPLAAGEQASPPRVAPRPPVGEMPTLWQATRLVLIVFAALAILGLLAQYLHPAH